MIMHWYEQLSVLFLRQWRENTAFTLSRFNTETTLEKLTKVACVITCKPNMRQLVGESNHTYP